MRLDIRYATTFSYDAPVRESQNELRACPATDARQALVHYHVTTTPSSRVTSYVDFWGTRVDTFGIRAPHDRLEVVAEATVETDAQPPLADTVDVAEVQAPLFVENHLEYLQPSPHVRWSGDVADAAHACRESAGPRLADVVMAVHDRCSELTYRTGETYVGVPVDDVFRGGSGVCQDFAHLSLAMYRELGIPARYVSGYLFAVDDATGQDAGADEVRVETHAWVEVAVPGQGWYALDPTNRQPVGERHVTIGRGRDYDDVAPFRGVFNGRSEHTLEVVVTMRRLAVEPTGSALTSEPERAVRGHAAVGAAASRDQALQIAQQQ